MKKIILLAATATAFTTAANAQMKIGIAPEIGLNLANMHGKDSTATGVKDRENMKLKLGVKVGANVNIPIGDRLVLQPGLFYSIKGYKHEESESETDTLSGIITTYREEEKENVTLHYFEVPVNLQYNFNDIGEGRLFIGIGGYIGVAFSGHNKASGSLTTTVGGVSRTSSGDTTVKLTFGDDKTRVNTSAGQTEYRRIDGGVSANIGYMLQSGIFFRGMYQLGLANLVPGESSDVTLKHSVFTISLGYQLGGRPESNKRKAKAGSM